MKLRFLNRLGFFLLALGSGAFPATAQAQLMAKAEFVGDGSFSLPTAGEGALRRPRSLAWEGNDQIHVADERGPVAVFTAEGAFVRSYGVGTLKKVASLAIDGAGQAYVLDPDQKIVFVFDSTGQVVHQIGSPGGRAGQLDEPLDVAVGPTGLVYVLDKGRQGIQVFSLDGTFVHDVVLPVEAEEPRALAVSPDGGIYVVDKDMPGLLLHLPNLTVALATVDAPPPEIEVLRIRSGVMEDPVSVVSSPTGTIAMGDRDTGVLWSTDGTGGAPVGSDDRLYGGSGSGRGSFRKLEDIALAGRDELLILDGEGRKIERIRLVLEASRTAEDPMDYPVQFQTLPPPLGQGILATAARPGGTIWYAIADAGGRNLRVVEARLTDWVGVFENRIRLPELLPGSATHAFGQVVEQAGYASLNDTLLVVTEPRQDNLSAAVQLALTALANPTAASIEQLSSLRQLVFANAWELKDWGQAAAMGEEIMRVTGATDPSLRDRVLRAHLEDGSPERAQELIDQAYAASPTAAERHRLETLELITAAAIGDYVRAMELAPLVGNTLDADLFISYQGALAAARVQTGDRRGARFELLSLLEDPRDAAALEDAIVARSVLLVYGSYVEDGQAEAGRSMLDSLVAALPPELSEVRGSVLQRADSVAAVADTRGKLGEGFQLYRDALFRDALRFLQAADERTDLDVDQRLIVKELMAGVLYSFQRI